jgi:hypothetical protein
MNSDKWLREWQQPNLKYRHSPTYAIVMVWKVQCESYFVQVRIEYIYMVDYNCTYKGTKFKLKFETQRNLIGHSWSLCCLCYGPAIFFCHPCLIALSFPQGKIRYRFTECYYFPLFLLFKNCISLHLHNFKLCTPQSVCTKVSDGNAENHTEPDRTANLWTDIWI